MIILQVSKWLTFGMTLYDLIAVCLFVTGCNTKCTQELSAGMQHYCYLAFSIAIYLLPRFISCNMRLDVWQSQSLVIVVVLVSAAD